MKTARISFLVERVDRVHHSAVASGTDFHVHLGSNHCQVIGTPKVEIDEHHRCSMSAAQLLAAMRGFRQYGGSFAERLADLLEVADSGNTEKLMDAFHDVLWGYVPMGEEV